MTGAGHAQHSKEATFACGLERFHFISGPACPLALPPWGSPRPQCLPASFATVHNARALVLFVSVSFILVYFRSFSLCSSTATRDVRSCIQYLQLQVTPNAVHCTGTETHVFCFLTTEGSLSCTTKVSVAEQ